MTNDSDMTAALERLSAELDRWQSAGRTAEFWWRDDDATEPCAELTQLVRRARAEGAPCGLAVIPAKVMPALVAELDDSPCRVLQHGWAHVNHAPRGQGGWEFGSHRHTAILLDELRRGRDVLAGLFGGGFVPGFVPPWNKIAPEAARLLPQAGLCGLSCTWKKANPEFSGVVRADAHADVLHWQNRQARFAGAERVCDELLDHLIFKRRQGTESCRDQAATMDAQQSDNAVGACESAAARVLSDRGACAPTCVLTHHLEMDRASWQFMDELLALVNAHAAARWVDPASFWPCGGRA